MTTDIKELMQTLSIERIKEIASGATPVMGEKERLAITALYFAEQHQMAVDALQDCGRTLKAAEEALEAKDARIAELETYIEIHERTAVAAIERAEMADRRAVELQSRAEAAEKCLSSLAAVSRRYLPDYDEHPEIQAADDLLEQNSLVTARIQIQGGG
ncbi:hypothetical protein PLGE761_02335 [Pluralibacter gergoviae]|uniref:hypothetical protein n=1 Tax=Pluralibacter gergoviae TaxID=61647 RepID=UPI0007DAE0DB|nr:hypothetical protein [Pluralibacter gergoviae]SUB71821.1 Uncharacterised protein [Pluralibacter gergoviae]